MSFPEMVATEIEFARKKFPSAEGVHTALVEEVGEVAKALLDEDWTRVVAECVQVAAMAQRLAEEGDSTLASLRWKRVHHAGTRFLAINQCMPGRERDLMYKEQAP